MLFLYTRIVSLISELDMEEKSQHFSNPLLIGCSGGNGHNSAVLAIAEKLSAAGICLPLHLPRPWTENRIKKSATARLILQSLKWTHHGTPGKLLSAALKNTPLPLLPPPEEIFDEISALALQNAAPRNYVDMLLDVLPAGYIGAAIFNILQRNDRVSEISKLISFKKWSDRKNYRGIRNYFTRLLQLHQNNGKPFTSVLSTQPIGFAALCDAVTSYNKRQSAKQKIIIYQFVTDLATTGATHFFETLSTLDATQRKNMHLAFINIHKKTPDIISSICHHQPPFRGMTALRPENNPMVRKGFFCPSLKKISFNKNLTLKINTEFNEQKIDILAEETVTSIMLGSLAGIETVSYAEQALHAGFDKIFIFGGKNRELSPLLNKIGRCKAMRGHDLIEHPATKGQIISLAKQEDIHIAPIMTRSQLVIIRAGGLSTMEQMAMPHNAGQTVMIHQNETPDRRLTSGLPWEDSNAEKLAEFLQIQGVQVQNTSIKRFAHHCRAATNYFSGSKQLEETNNTSLALQTESSE